MPLEPKRKRPTARARCDPSRSQTRPVGRAPRVRHPTTPITFSLRLFLNHLPHGLIGLLITVFLAATLSSKAAELNALGSTTTVDLYRHIITRQATEAHYLMASRCFTAMWGLIAICFALFANMAENLIQAVNIVGSIFYGVVLGMFLVAFFVRWIGGTAVFYAAHRFTGDGDRPLLHDSHQLPLVQRHWLRALCRIERVLADWPRPD